MTRQNNLLNKLGVLDIVRLRTYPHNLKCIITAKGNNYENNNFY